MAVDEHHEAHGPQTFISKYVFSLDHKVIGLQYIFTAMFMGLVGGGLAVLIRMQLAAGAGAEVVPAETYISLVTMHGTIMVFFVVSLALVSGFGNILIPLMLGARDMAYPFLNMLSYWTIVPACLMMLVSFWAEGGAAASGWTAYPPLSALPEAVPGSGLGQSLWLGAMALFIVSFTMGGLNYICTILNCRAKGMGLMQMPLTVWTYFLSAILGVLSFPALTAAAVMLLLDRHLGTSFYLPAGMVFGNETLPYEGGTPLLFQHLFWFLGHPEVYVLLLPGLGIAFDIVATFARRPPYGYRLSVYALGAVGFLSMIVWGHHMYVTGMNPYVGEYFSIATVIITAPFALLGLNLIASIWRGRIRMRVPMLFALGIIVTVGAGGFGGLYLATSVSDIYFHESFFVVGHFHLMIGVVTLLATFGGLYYWFPKLFGRMMNETLGKVHFWFTFVPLFALFILMHYQGMSGLIRRYFDHSIYEFAAPGMKLAQTISTLTYIAAGVQVLFFWNFFSSIWRGEKASDNPWEATTLDWAGPSPAPHGNYGANSPVAHRNPYEYDPSREAGADYTPQASA